jgi:peptidoglycan/xylan/chitin deacetylase (PgdA/CDA1 family)
MYAVATPPWLRLLYPNLRWQYPPSEKAIYLTFDDGPTPNITDFVLEQLHRYHAQATFFCLGRQIEQHYNLYDCIVAEGHQIGNHTYDHPNGWHTDNADYIANIAACACLVNSPLFRPPYGRITPRQISLIRRDIALLLPDVSSEQRAGILPQIVMWNVMSGDFDSAISPEKCLSHVIDHAAQGAIVVFHDTAAAFERLQYALPRVLRHYAELGYIFKACTL